jgi:hypothetical protein
MAIGLSYKHAMPLITPFGIWHFYFECWALINQEDMNLTDPHHPYIYFLIYLLEI